MKRARWDGAGGLRAIVWDMDGTLIDSASAVPDAYVQAVARLGGGRVTRDEVIAAYRLGPAGLILAHLLGRASTPADVQEYLACLRANAPTARPYPGIAPTLAALRGRVELAVFTGASHASALTLLEPAGLLRYFARVIGGDEIEHQKPAPDGVLRTCQDLGVEPTAAVYVGDSPVDLEAARRGGAGAVAAGWGHFYSATAPADLVLSRPEELLEIVRADPARA